MRIKNTIRNSMYSVFFQLFTLIVGFFIPKLVIGTYGSEINGLTTNVSQLINLINLLQAGMIGASIFEMFGPIARQDYKLVGHIFFSSKKYFHRISYLFFVLTLVAIPYILVVSKSSLDPADVILSVLILGLNATLVFRYVCTYDVIFTAHQMKYTLVISSIIEKIVYYVLLFMVIFFRFNYLYMYVAALIATVFRIGYLECKYRSNYKSLIQQYEQLTDYKIRNQYRLFGNQLVQNILEAAPTLLVTAVYGLTYASIYSVYLLIVNIFKMIFTTVQNSIAPSFGDLVASGNKQRILEVFNILQMLFVVSSMIICSTMSVVYAPFIKLYCIDATEIQYVYNGLAIAMVLYLLLYIQFLVYNMMINSYGYYGKVIKTNILVGIISLVFAIVVTIFDFRYTYLGIALFYGISIIHRYILLKREGIELSAKNFVRVFISLAFVLMTFVLSEKLVLQFNNWIEWFFKSAGMFFISCVVAGIYIGIVERKEFSNLRHILIDVLKRR